MVKTKGIRIDKNGKMLRDKRYKEVSWMLEENEIEERDRAFKAMDEAPPVRENNIPQILSGDFTIDIPAMWDAAEKRINMKKVKMTILVTADVRNALYHLQVKSVREGKKKSFGTIIEELLDGNKS